MADSRNLGYGEVEDVDNLVIWWYLIGLLIFGINGIIMVGMRQTHADIMREREELNRQMQRYRMNRRR